MPDEALYVPDGGSFRPTELTQGPWAEGAQHGGPPSALLARAIERQETPAPMELVRLTVELLRPVPLRPLQAGASIVRAGRKVQLVEAQLHDGGTAVARATGLRLRRGDATAPAPDDEGPPGPETGIARDWSDFGHGYHDQGVEMSVVASSHGRMTAWLRLRAPIVLGEEPSPAQRAAAFADFGNGLSPIVDPADTTYVNPDLTVYLHRRPVGEWICLEARTLAGEPGIAMAESRLYDRGGPVGRAVQSLLLEPR